LVPELFGDIEEVLCNGEEEKQIGLQPRYQTETTTRLLSTFSER
jgi:hypothetical protein